MKHAPYHLKSMSTTKNEPKGKFCIVIPARLESKRLPRKPLLEVNGKPLIEHIYTTALACHAEQTIVATNSKEIFECVQNFGGRCFLSETSHATGSDRVAEVARELAWEDEQVIVNWQSDELLLEPEHISRLVNYLSKELKARPDMATLVKPLDPKDRDDPNVVKVVGNKEKFALYFSRACIPYTANHSNASSTTHLHHLGIYAYTCRSLLHFFALPQSPLEQVESLEQLRILEQGGKIYIGDTIVSKAMEINTIKDLHKIQNLLK